MSVQPCQRAAYRVNPLHPIPTAAELPLSKRRHPRDEHPSWVGRVCRRFLEYLLLAVPILAIVYFGGRWLPMPALFIPGAHAISLPAVSSALSLLSNGAVNCAQLALGASAVASTSTIVVAGIDHRRFYVRSLFAPPPSPPAYVTGCQGLAAVCALLCLALCTARRPVTGAMTITFGY